MEETQKIPFPRTKKEVKKLISVLAGKGVISQDDREFVLDLLAQTGEDELQPMQMVALAYFLECSIVWQHKKNPKARFEQFMAPVYSKGWNKKPAEFPCSRKE